jgi:hypothetical protein
MRLAIAILVALAVGAVGGTLVIQHRLNPQLQAALEQDASREAEMKRLARELDRTRQRLDLSRTELSKMARERDALRDELQALEETVPAQQDLSFDTMLAPDAAIELEPEASAEGQPALEAPRSERPDGDRRRDSPWRNPEARREFMAQIRDRSMNFLQDRIDSTTDPVVQDRLAAIGDYLDYMMDLGAQMRDAETEEERDALRETMGQTRDEFQGLVREQQDYMVRQLAEEYGITGTEEQDEFIASLQGMRQSPFFSSPMMQWGFGRPGRGRGPLTGVSGNRPGGPSGGTPAAPQP